MKLKLALFHFLVAAQLQNDPCPALAAQLQSECSLTQCVSLQPVIDRVFVSCRQDLFATTAASQCTRICNGLPRAAASNPESNPTTVDQQACETFVRANIQKLQSTCPPLLVDELPGLRLTDSLQIKGFCSNCLPAIQLFIANARQAGCAQLKIPDLRNLTIDLYQRAYQVYMNTICKTSSDGGYCSIFYNNLRQRGEVRARLFCNDCAKDQYNSLRSGPTEDSVIMGLKNRLGESLKKECTQDFLKDIVIDNGACVLIKPGIFVIPFLLLVL